MLQSEGVKAQDANLALAEASRKSRGVSQNPQALFASSCRGSKNRHSAHRPRSPALHSREHPRSDWLSSRRSESEGEGSGLRGRGAASRRGSSSTQEPAGARRLRRAAGRGGRDGRQTRAADNLQLPRTSNGNRRMVEGSPRRARRRGSGCGGPTGAERPERPGPPPREALGGCGGAWPRQVWACRARNSRVRAYAADGRAEFAHAPGWPQKTHNSPAHPTSPVSGRSAHGGRSYVFCSALSATVLAFLVLGEPEFGRSSVNIASLKRLQI